MAAAATATATASRRAGPELAGRGAAGFSRHLAAVSAASASPAGRGPRRAGVAALPTLGLAGIGRCGCGRHLGVDPACRPERQGAASRRERQWGAGRLPAATYYRRRLVLAVVVTALALAAWAAVVAPRGAGTASGRAAAAAPTGARPPVVEVRAGDTLWSVALRLRPGGDPRPLVDRLAAEHGGTVVHAGERIAMPAVA